MLDNNQFCVECMHIISNPLCSSCFKEEVLSWLKDKQINNKEIKKVRRDFSTLINKNANKLNNTKCVICGHDAVNLCTFCFIKESEKIISKEINNEYILKRFKEDFNLDIWMI